MTTIEMTATISASVAAVSLVTNIVLAFFLHRVNGRRNEYDFIDTQIADILKIQMQYPNYRRDGFVPGEEEDKLRFDAYCCLVWNSLETMFEKYGAKRLRKSSFLPAMKLLAKRHKAWMDIHEGKGYDKKLRQFLVE